MAGFTQGKKKEKESPSPSQVMNSKSNTQEKVNHKIYDLLPPSFLDRLLQSPKPVYEVNPLMPPGCEISCYWEYPEPQPSPGFQVAYEGGFSSKRLVKAGNVWYLKEFYDETGEPFRLKYGKHRDETEKLQYWEAYRAWAQEEYEKSTEEQEIAEISESGTPEPTEEERLLRKKHNRAISKQRFRELVNANDFRYMFTFTFAPGPNKNVKDLRFYLSIDEQKDRKEVFKAWHKRLTFIRKKLKEIGNNFKYVLVAEKHTGRKSRDQGSEKIGTYHLHLATDKPIDIHLLRKWWGYGIVHVQNFDKPLKGKRNEKITDPGNYMAKYMEKDFDDSALHNMRAYTCSQNLIRPIPERDEQTVEECLSTSSAECYTVHDVLYKAQYETVDFQGKPETVTFFVRSRIFNFRTEKKVSFPSFNFQTMLDKIRGGP